MSPRVLEFWGRALAEAPSPPGGGEGATRFGGTHTHTQAHTERSKGEQRCGKSVG